MTMLRNVSIVLRGSIIAQGIGFLALPLMSRLLPVEAFGQFQIYQSLLAVGFVFVALRYELALLRCKGEAELLATFQLCILINIAFAGVAGLSYFVIRQNELSSTVLQLAFGAGMLSAGLLLGGVLQTVGYLVTREEGFREAAHAKVLQSTSYVSAGIGLGYGAPTLAALVWADIAGRAAAATLLLMRLPRFGIASFLPVRPRRIRAVARKYRHYALLTVPGSLLSAFAIAVVPMALFGLYGATTAGQFALVERAVTLPVNLVAFAVMQVFTAKLAKELRAGGRGGQAMYRETLVRLALIGIIPGAVFFFIAPPFFRIAFGPEWRLAGELAQVLALYQFVSFVVGGVLHTLVTAGAQRQQIWWEVGRFFAVATVWSVVVAAGLGVKVAVALHFGVQIVGYGVYVVIADRVLRDSSKFCRARMTEPGPSQIVGAK